MSGVSAAWELAGVPEPSAVPADPPTIPPAVPPTGPPTVPAAGPPTVPVATARIQLATIGGAAGVMRAIEHLAALGVSHLYTSPATAAVPGSTHGYDQTDPSIVGEWATGDGGDEDDGGGDAVQVVADALERHGMGWVVDVVPNHLAAHHTNPAWWDVLRRGKTSPYASWFDLHWEHGDELVPDRLLLAVLGDHYGVELDRGAITLERLGQPGGLTGGWCVAYGDRRFPLAEGTDADAQAIAADAAATGAIDTERLHEVLHRQHYRLAWWRIADSELDHRRFFDVDDLVGVRVEDPDVFAATHRLHLEWVERGLVSGLRIDHPDGLSDPATYFTRLRAAAPNAWIVVEKILVGDEQLRDWPVDGTTGYEAGALLDRVFVDPGGLEQLDLAVERLTAEASPTWDDVTLLAKRDVLDASFAAEMRRLVDDLIAAAVDAPHRLDLSRAAAEQAIRDVLVAMPVYRTYAIDGDEVDALDAAVLDRLTAELADRTSDADPMVIELILGLLRGPVTSEAAVRFRLRFQQTSGPVMAKGVEDTACYRFPRLVSTNEVGADPDRPTVTLDGLHTELLDASAHWPHRMVTTSTHDSKRSEDVRARIAVLSEVADEWELAAKALDDRLGAFMGDLRDPIVELVVHQSIFGAHPVSAERGTEYARKVAREAKRLASWADADSEYEQSLVEGVRRCLHDPEYLRILDALVRRTASASRSNSLALKLLALTVPGVPDLYQGSEIVVRSLVDPDNRRPVDWERVASAVGHAREANGPLLDGDEDVAKARVVLAALAARRAHRDGYLGRDTYRPLVAEGSGTDHLVAFVRGGETATLVTRWTVRLERQGGWGDTTVQLPDGRWTDAFTGAVHEGTVPVADVLRVDPIALLERS